jgi:hypothetical protein
MTRPIQACLKIMEPSEASTETAKREGLRPLGRREGCVCIVSLISPIGVI